MHRDVALVNALKLALVLGDTSNHVEARGGMTNLALDRAEMTINLKENGEEKSFTLCE